MAEQNSSPIGVFDSGVGGVSVMREISSLLPSENIIYFADSANVPYGNKSPEFIAKRCHEISHFLISKSCKIIVIACNTATASAIKSLRTAFPDTPFVGMEPAVKPATTASRVKKIGVLATVGTLKSALFAALLDKFAAGTEVIAQPAPGLVECVENGELNTDATKKLVKSFVEPLLKKEVDVIVLGCTHYPFLKSVIAEIAGPHVKLVDTGEAVARQVTRILSKSRLLADKNETPQFEFFTSGDAKKAEDVISVLWKSSVKVNSV